jgi:predicted Ser/Thr protein kinase
MESIESYNHNQTKEQIQNPIQKKNTIANVNNLKQKEQNFKIESEIKLGKDFTINSQKMLGTGSFGVIYSGINNKTKEEVAIKIESLNTDTPQLIYESKILKMLQGGSNLNKNKFD